MEIPNVLFLKKGLEDLIEESKNDGEVKHDLIFDLKLICKENFKSTLYLPDQRFNNLFAKLFSALKDLEQKKNWAIELLTKDLDELQSLILEFELRK